jgi:hypothetical protein
MDFGQYSISEAALLTVDLSSLTWIALQLSLNASVSVLL